MNRKMEGMMGEIGNLRDKEQRILEQLHFVLEEKENLYAGTVMF